MTGPSEFDALARDLTVAGLKSVPAVRGAIQAGAGLVKNAWTANARITAGKHGKHYPNSITYETRITSNGAEGEVGPDASRPQGGMGRGFEFGSKNQPPHLDGVKATEKLTPVLEKLLDDAISKVLP